MNLQYVPWQASCDAPNQTNSNSFSYHCVFFSNTFISRFYQIRASLKVPTRVPHKVETSLLHPGGKYISEDMYSITQVCIHRFWCSLLCSLKGFNYLGWSSLSTLSLALFCAMFQLYPSKTSQVQLQHYSVSVGNQLLPVQIWFTSDGRKLVGPWHI